MRHAEQKSLAVPETSWNSNTKRAGLGLRPTGRAMACRGPRLLFRSCNEMSASLDLRGHLRPPGSGQLPEEPGREPLAPRYGPVASSAAPPKAASIAHEAVKEVDVEGVETRPVYRQPDRDVPGRTGQWTCLPVRMAKACRTLRVAPDSQNQGIPLRNHIGEWRTKLFRRYVHSCQRCSGSGIHITVRFPLFPLESDAGPLVRSLLKTRCRSPICCGLVT